MHRDRHVSLWPSVSVCSLIRPGNSIGPRSEGEQRYQMDSWRGVEIRKKNKMDRKKGENGRENTHTHTGKHTHNYTLSKLS